MVPQSQQRKVRNSSKVNLLISLAFHSVIVIALVYFAARQGLLGKKIQKISVEMVKEKPPEKLKEPEKPKEDVPKPEAPKEVLAPRVDQPKEAPPPPASTMTAPPAIAPPALDAASFAFGGGAVVESSSDPVQVYKGILEYALLSRWNRPEDMADSAYTAEVEVSVDKSGRIANTVWKKGSGDKRWDDSVRQAIAQTTKLSAAPPTNFPPQVTIRFDVVEAEPVVP